MSQMEKKNHVIEKKKNDRGVGLDYQLTRVISNSIKSIE